MFYIQSYWIYNDDFCIILLRKTLIFEVSNIIKVPHEYSMCCVYVYKKYFVLTYITAKNTRTKFEEQKQPHPAEYSILLFKCDNNGSNYFIVLLYLL